jgi:hypothetical protein
MVSLVERAYRLVVIARYLAISRFICGSGGRVARPWSRSATHSDWISATGMIAPIGWTSPMKYSPASFGGTMRWYRGIWPPSAPIRASSRNGKLILYPVQ